MLNPAADLLHHTDGLDYLEKSKDIVKFPYGAQSESLIHGKEVPVTAIPSSLQSMKKSVSSLSLTYQKQSKSPKDKRKKLPDAPKAKVNMSRSSENIHRLTIDEGSPRVDSLLGKFKYNSMPRKKNAPSNERKLSSSTFYINNDSNPGSPKQSRPEVDAAENKGSNSILSGQPVAPESANTQTHVALYKFVARHKDEISFVDGDPIQVMKMHEDLWYEGINLLTGKQGFFPCRYVADILAKEISSDIDDATDHRQFHMRFLGSIEVSDYKGDEMLCFAIAKVVNQRSMLSSSTPASCVMQIAPRGIRVVETRQSSPQPILSQNAKKNKKTKSPSLPEKSRTEDGLSSHFFSLKNVTFCGNHPKDRRYFAFVTKHPDELRYACHVFMSNFSTDIVAKTLGECFKTFYETYMEYRAPTEDIYLE